MPLNFKRAKALLVALQATVMLSASGAIAAEPAPSSIEKAVNGAHILPAGYTVRARVAKAGTVVTLTTYKMSDAENDLKIAALLMTREIMTKFSSVSAVIVWYIDRVDTTVDSTVEVHHPDIKLFAMGGESKDRELASLPVKSTKSTQEAGNVDPSMVSSYAAVAPGQAKLQREAMLNAFKQLTANNVAIPRDLWTAFISIETRVRNGEAEEIMPALNRLEYKFKPYFAQANQHVGVQNSISNVSNLRAEWGPDMPRRQKILLRIADLARARQDVTQYQAKFAYELNPAARSGDRTKTDQLCREMEQALNMPPYTGP